MELIPKQVQERLCKIRKAEQNYRTYKSATQRKLIVVLSLANQIKKPIHQSGRAIYSQLVAELITIQFRLKRTFFLNT